MAKSRRIGNIITFTPPSFWTGVGQLADVWGDAAGDVYPPRIKYVVKAPSKAVAVSEPSDVKSALRRDIRKIGGDISRSIAKYAVKRGMKDV